MRPVRRRDVRLRVWGVWLGVAVASCGRSPTAPSSQACGHDGTNASHVANVVAHELVHVLHGQRNPSFFSIAASTSWILEGLAAYASGQWEAEYASTARSALGSGFAPTTFAGIWTSSANYALSGSVFAYVHQRFGTGAVRRLLAQQ